MTETDRAEALWDLQRECMELGAEVMRTHHIWSENRFQRGRLRACGEAMLKLADAMTRLRTQTLSALSTAPTEETEDR